MPSSLQRLHISDPDHMSEFRDQVRRARSSSGFPLQLVKLERLASVWSLPPVSSGADKRKYLAPREKALNYSQGSTVFRTVREQ